MSKEMSKAERSFFILHPSSFILLLPAIVVLPLAALPASAEQTAGLRLATFSCDTTPPLNGHPLIWVTPVAEVETPLLAKGVVLDDGDGRYVLCAIDWCGLCNSSYELFRSKIAAAAETDAARVAVHSIHQHTAPYTDGDAQRLLDENENPPRYVDFEFLDEVTDRAHEDRTHTASRSIARDGARPSGYPPERRRGRPPAVDGRRRARDHGRLPGSGDPALDASALALHRGRRPRVRRAKGRRSDCVLCSLLPSDLA